MDDLASLSDAQLAALPRQLQEITLKALDAVAAEIEPGHLTLEEANRESERLIDLQVAQQKLCYDEQMRRFQTRAKKRMVFAIFIVLVIAAAFAVLILQKNNAI